MSPGFRLLVSDLFDRKDGFAGFAWQPFKPGVTLAQLYRDGDDGPAAALLRYEPGASLPPHLHQGFEHIVILEGSQQDELGRYSRGCLLIHGPGTAHRVASPEGCIALAIWMKPVEML